MSRGVDRRRFLLLASALGLALAPRAGADAGAELPPATDLHADGRLATARRLPIVILFSLPGCPYCEIVRRSQLAPMLRDPRQSARAIIREIDIDGDAPLVGFAGERTTHAQIARAHGVRAAPVVAFWDGAGKPIAESLTGMLLPDFYSAYLEAALATAESKLR
jgi:thioredoxin-related protein